MQTIETKYMIKKFRLQTHQSNGFLYEVFEFSQEMYFIRSVSGSPATEGYMKGISIWKHNGVWVSSVGNDEKLVKYLGSLIDFTSAQIATR